MQNDEYGVFDSGPDSTLKKISWLAEEFLSGLVLLLAARTTPPFTDCALQLYVLEVVVFCWRYSTLW